MKKDLVQELEKTSIKIKNTFIKYYSNGNNALKYTLKIILKYFSKVNE